jgi:hypothetical protein
MCAARKKHNTKIFLGLLSTVVSVNITGGLFPIKKEISFQHLELVAHPLIKG